MRYKEFKYLILSDLYRVSGDIKLRSFIRHIFLGEGFKYNFWLRACAYAKENSILKITIYPLLWIILRHLTYKLGISIPPTTKIGSGFYIGHFGGIVINHQTIIGKNCNISHGVTLGQANRGSRKGFPTLGDNIYIGPGAKIIGAVKIGNNVAIGANCVVTKDIASNSVVAGVPGRVISSEGTQGYIDNIDYEFLIKN